MPKHQQPQPTLTPPPTYIQNGEDWIINPAFDEFCKTVYYSNRVAYDEKNRHRDIGRYTETGVVVPYPPHYSRMV